MRTRTPYRRPSRAERAERVRELRAMIDGLGRRQARSPSLDELLADDALSDAGDRTAEAIAHDVDRINTLLQQAAAEDRAAGRSPPR